MRMRICLLVWHLPAVSWKPFNELGCRIGYTTAELWRDWRDFVVCIQLIVVLLVTTAELKHIVALRSVESELF